MSASTFIAMIGRGLRATRVAVPWKRAAHSKQRDLSWLKQDTDACRESLNRFGRESDRDFTALAQGLAALNERLAALRGKAEQLDLLLQDKDDDQAVSSAYLLYKNALDLVHSSVGLAVSEQEQMNQIGQTLLRACHARDTFHRNHLMLRILTMNMRMEAVRLDTDNQATFINIAAAIAEIDHKIVLSTEAAFTRIEAVIAETDSTQSKELEKDLNACARTSVDRIQRELTSLKAALAPCAEQSREIAELIAQTAPRTLQVIGSLQHQDIVRQQLEHVSAGFSELYSHLQPDAPGPQHADSLELGYVYRATRVQQAHLRASRVEIEKAALEVSGGLQALLELSEPLVQRFAALEAAAVRAFRECNVAQIFEHEIQQLVQIADKSAAANDMSSRLVERIEEVVRVFSREIAGHELDVKIVALNAQIASAQMTGADSLSRIAEETGIVADENAVVTRELTRDLRSSLESLTGVKDSAAKFIAIAAREKQDLQRSNETVGEKLRRLGVRIQSDSANVRQEFEQAYGENRGLLDSVNFPSLIEECYAPAERLCEQLLHAASGHGTDATISDEAAVKLETHRRRYTMQKENEIHATALGAAPHAPAFSSDEPELFIDAPAEDPAAAFTIKTATLIGAVAHAAGVPAASSETEPSARIQQPASSTELAPGKPDFGDGIELF